MLGLKGAVAEKIQLTGIDGAIVAMEQGIVLGGQLQACAAIGAKGLGQVAAFAKAWGVDIDVSGGLQIDLLEILHPGVEHSVDDLGGVLGVDADRVFDVDLGAFDFDIEEAAGGGLFELDAYRYGIAFEVGLIKVGIRAARREAGQATRMDDFPFLVKGVAEGLGAHLGDLNRSVQATERADITNRWRGGDRLGGLGGGGLSGGGLEFGALGCVGLGGGGCMLHRVDRGLGFGLGRCGGLVGFGLRDAIGFGR